MTRLMVCLGPGGVGKTTASAALALAASRLGLRSVVLTVDPARRLADALGVTGTVGNTPIRVDRSLESGGELWATMLDSPATLHDLIHDLATSPEQAGAITGNRIFTNLTDSLSGTHEYMAAERLRQLVVDAHFDLVVVDTPPAHHALDFLDSPGRLTRFFDHRLYRSVLAPRHGLMRAVNAAAQLAMRAVARVVGADLLRDVTDLFELLEGIDTAFRDRAASVDLLLTAPDTSYVVITSPRPDPVRTTEWMTAELAQRGLAVELIVANRLTPQFGSVDASADLGPALRSNLEELTDLAAGERALVADLGTTTGANHLLEIDELAVPAVGLTDLTTLAEAIEPYWVSRLPR